MLHSNMVEAGEADEYDEAIRYQKLKEERLTALAAEEAEALATPDPRSELVAQLAPSPEYTASLENLGKLRANAKANHEYDNCKVIASETQATKLLEEERVSSAQAKLAHFDESFKNAHSDLARYSVLSDQVSALEASVQSSAAARNFQSAGEFQRQLTSKTAETNRIGARTYLGHPISKIHSGEARPFGRHYSLASKAPPSPPPASPKPPPPLPTPSVPLSDPAADEAHSPPLLSRPPSTTSAQHPQHPSILDGMGPFPSLPPSPGPPGSPEIDLDAISIFAPILPFSEAPSPGPTPRALSFRFKHQQWSVPQSMVPAYQNMCFHVSKSSDGSSKVTPTKVFSVRHPTNTPPPLETWPLVAPRGNLYVVANGSLGGEVIHGIFAQWDGPGGAKECVMGVSYAQSKRVPTLLDAINLLAYYIWGPCISPGSMKCLAPLYRCLGTATPRNLIVGQAMVSTKDMPRRCFSSVFAEQRRKRIAGLHAKTHPSLGPSTR